MRFSFLYICWFHNASVDWTTLFLCQSRSILPKAYKKQRFSSLLIVNQASTMVLLTAFFMLTTWLEEKERERRIQRYLNLVMLVVWLEEIRRNMEWEDNLLHADPQPGEPYPLPEAA